MKKILIIDSEGRAAHPDFSPYPWVDFREEVQCPENLDAADYATAFVHQSNEEEARWAKRAFKPNPVFFFSGGKDRWFPKDHMVFMPRAHYRERIEEFLAHYAKTGQVLSDFFKPGSDKATAVHRQEIKRMSTTRAIRFTVDSIASDPWCYPIYLLPEEDGIDFHRSLLPLADVKTVVPFFIETSYHSVGDGLDIALRIRLAASLGGSFSLFPIYLHLDATGLTHYLRSDPKYALLLATGTHLVDELAEIPDSPPSALADAQLLRILENHPLRPEGQIDAHDLSNEWGALRLWEGWRMLTADDAEPPPAWRRRREELLSREYYWYLLALVTLGGQQPTSPGIKASPEAINSLLQWRNFLEQQRAKPLQVLLIDDEADKGWEDALREVLCEIEGAAKLLCYPIEEMFDAKQAEACATSQDWDLILCDLRLTPQDREAAKKATDPTFREQFAGFQILNAVKQRNPTIPFIAFTASNRSWTLRALESSGTDGYWVKESPEHGVSDTYTCRNTLDLLGIIEHVVRERRERAFLWDLVRDIQEATQQEAYIRQFTRLGTLQEQVVERLAAVENLLLRAYAQLKYQPTAFQQRNFRYSPLALAFIHLWGCINEIRHLRFQNNPRGACYMLNASGKKVEIWQCKPNSIPEDFILKLLDKVSNSVPIFKPCAGERSKQGKDDVYISLLLLHGGQEDLEAQLDRCRETRNGLDIIHGDAYRQAASTVSMEEHLEPMAAIIRFTLFL